MTNAYRKQWEIILYVSLSWLLPLQTVKATLSIWFRMCTTHLGLTSPQRPLSCHANPPPPPHYIPHQKYFLYKNTALQKMLHVKIFTCFLIVFSFLLVAAWSFEDWPSKRWPTLTPCLCDRSHLWPGCLFVWLLGGKLYLNEALLDSCNVYTASHFPFIEVWWDQQQL